MQLVGRIFRWALAEWLSWILLISAYFYHTIKNLWLFLLIIIMGGSDFYQVLGLNKECTDAELRTAYKKLALKWHPDRCSDVEEAKMKFQAIQEAYSVLSDVNKRFLYDVGVYDSDDDQDGMADFMSEMAVLMSQNKPNGNGDTFEELKDLFVELFEESENPTSYSSSTFGESSSSSSSNKRASSAVSNEGPSRFQLGAEEDTRRHA